MVDGEKPNVVGVPDGWERTTLGEQLARVVGGGTPDRQNPEYWSDSDGIPWVTVKDMTQRRINNAKEHITPLGLKESASNLIPAGTLLMSTRMAVGRTTICKLDAAINQDLKALFPKGSMSVGFLEVLTEKIEPELDALGTGSTVKGIRLEQLNDFPILLPPLPEQQKIAAILSTWDESISTLTKLLAAKQQQKRGLAEALLTGKKRLPGFEGEWEEVNIGSLFESSMAGEWGKEADDSDFTIPVIRATNFSKSGELDLREEKLVNRAIPEKKFQKILLKAGDIVLEKSGGSPDQPVGRVRYFDASGNYGFSNFMNRLRPKPLFNSKFIFYVLNHFYETKKVLEYQQQTTGIINLQLQDYLEFGKVSLPPLLEQQAIAAILSTLDAEISSLTRLKASVQQQKRGLMEVLLTGRVRVAV